MANIREPLINVVKENKRKVLDCDGYAGNGRVPRGLTRLGQKARGQV